MPEQVTWILGSSPRMTIYYIMNKIETFVTFVLLWWMVFYLTLPFGVKKEDNPIPGQAMGAPKNHYIKQKMLWATGITFIITLILYLYMNS